MLECQVRRPDRLDSFSQIFSSSRITNECRFLSKYAWGKRKRDMSDISLIEGRSLEMDYLFPRINLF